MRLLPPNHGKAGMRSRPGNSFIDSITHSLAHSLTHSPSIPLPLLVPFTLPALTLTLTLTRFLHWALLMFSSCLSISAPTLFLSTPISAFFSLQNAYSFVELPSVSISLPCWILIGRSFAAFSTYTHPRMDVWLLPPAVQPQLPWPIDRREIACVRAKLKGPDPKHWIQREGPRNIPLVSSPYKSHSPLLDRKC
jgi:hypothetical protein